jgi:hypothetical protein
MAFMVCNGTAIKGYRRKLPWSVLRYSLRMHLQEPRKTPEVLSQVSLPPDGGSDSKYEEAGVVTAVPRLLVAMTRLCYSHEVFNWDFC